MQAIFSTLDETHEDVSPVKPSPLFTASLYPHQQAFLSWAVHRENPEQKGSLFVVLDLTHLSSNETVIASHSFLRDAACDEDCCECENVVR